MRGIPGSRRALGTVAFVVALTALPVSARPTAASVFALVNTGELFVSVDQGASWSVRAALPVSDAAGLIAGSSSQELFLVSRSGSVYRSPDAGMTWNGVGALGASDVVDLAGRTDGGLLALTRTGTVWLSTDEGASFTALGTFTAPNLVSLVLGPDGDPYALTRTGEVARSMDDGATWDVAGTFPVSDAVSLRRKDTSLFALTGTGLTLESIDQGVTWTPVGTVSQVGMRGLTQAVNQLLAVTKEGLTARSNDGSAWSWVGSVNQLEVIALANDVPQATGVPDNPGTPPRIVLAPPRPNPLRVGQALNLEFSLPTDARIRLELFDAAGRLAARRDPASLFMGDRVGLAWNPGAVPAGVYFLRIRSDSGFDEGRRVILVP